MKVPPLLALPAELRNQIWELAIARQWAESVDFYQSFFELSRCSQLLLCCRQIKNEAQTFFDETRKKFLKETELILTVRPAGSSKEHLREHFRYLDLLHDDDVVDITSMVLCSPCQSVHQGSVVRELPTCTFHDGSWRCQWSRANPFTGSSSRVIQFSKTVRGEVEGRILSDTVKILIKGRKFSLMGSGCQLQAFAFPRTMREDIRPIVAAARSERLSKEHIKFMLAFQSHSWVEMH
jgi:hypothetical protein